VKLFQPGVLAGAALAMVALLSASTAANAQTDGEQRYAAVVIDARSGEVLHARYADRLRHPASLTKLMTLYLAFEDIRAGKAGLGDRLRVSAHAAAQAPVDIGLKEGDSIRMLDALKAIIVQSANDAAVVVAERLGGDETQFAARMTAKARALGMTRTRFVNASGLPDPDQVSTARDIAHLAQALREDFPEYYPMFEVRHMEWGGRSFATHNRILDLVDGADGLKTGYVDASGYNIAASAVRNQESLVAVVLGGPTADTRDAHAALLLERGFEELATRRERGEFITVADHEAGDAGREQRLRIILERAEAVTSEDGPGIENTPLPPVDAHPAPPAESRTAHTPSSPSGASSSAAAAHTPSRTTAGEWRIQVGAFQDQRRADALLEALLPTATGPDGPDTPTLIRLITPAINLSPPLFRAQLVGFPDRTAADAACVRVKAADAPCFVIAP
jgi:D-alanyl-D-alanine carboxypeptidase